MKNSKNKNLNKGGRPVDRVAVDEIKRLVNKLGMSFRQSLPYMEKKLGRKVDIKTAHRWYKYGAK